MKNLTKAVLTTLASSFLLASLAHAAPVVISGADPGAGPTDPRPNSVAAAATYDAAASALGTNTIINFESAPVGSFSSLVVAPGVTLTGTDFFGNNQSIQNSPHDPGAPALDGYNTTAGGSNYAEVQGGTLNFAFAKPIDTFGLYFSGDQDPTFGSVTLTFNDGSSQSLPFTPLGPNGGLEFFGFTDAGALISGITIVSGSGGAGDFTGADDVRFGRPTSSVPDTGTSALLLGLGLVGLFFFRSSIIKFGPQLR